MRPFFTICMILTSCLFLGCASTMEMTIRQVTPLPPEHNTALLAGVGKADITPRPGMPLAGYSANANYGTGFRTRLYTRTIYLKSPGRRPVVLVQCDLLAGSEILHRRVAELVAGKTDLDLGGIVISGTHTHSGPGNLAGSNFYLTYTGNSGGLDLKFFNFVADQVARAIVDAYNDRRPARIATGSTDIFGFTRNRNIEAYKNNNNAETKDIFRAVNPRMHMLRVDCLDKNKGVYIPGAAFTSFSVHGTVVPHNNNLYNGDVFAYVERELEWEMQHRYGLQPFVHAVVNGTHADSAPNATATLGFGEARRLGLGLAQKSMRLFDSLSQQLSSNASVEAAIREIDYYQTNTADGIALCATPRVGMPLLAGVKDGGDTPVLRSLPFFKEGSHRWIFTGGCHGNKRIFAWPFQSLIVSPADFPHLITYQVVRIGNLLLLPLPYEVTNESGRRIVDACRKSALEAGLTPDADFVVVSVSNGYTGYCTTPEEYAIQRYEGGHTIYGPNTNPFIAAQTARLVRDLVIKGEIRDAAPVWNYNLKSGTFYKEYDPPEGKRCSVKDPVWKQGDENYWEFSWNDVPPSLIDFHLPLISIEYTDNGLNWLPLEDRGIRVNDDGYDLAVRFTGRITVEKMGIYEGRWYNPEKKAGRQYRFRIEPRSSQKTLFSASFDEHAP